MSSRRLVPIKRGEGEPLTRADLQYDFLHRVFSDRQPVFSDPWPNSIDSIAPKLTFHELYIKALLNSTKTTKAFRDKLIESDTFAEDFAMIALLVNVGRINTTMSFFPEMKTTIRSYHPVPALQRTSGNLQDAPRIKHILKSVPLESETNGPSHLPADILSRLSSGHVPPTTVTNLIFVLANHSPTIGQLYLADNVDFIDLFMRADLSSASRANAFLWLCFNYLEGPSLDSEDDYGNDVVVNPFGDSSKDGKLSFMHLTAEEAALENTDPPDELERAEKLMEHRSNLLQGLPSKAKDKTTPTANDSVADDHSDTIGLGGEEIVLIPKGKRKRENPPTSKISRNATKHQKSAGDKMAKSRKSKGKAAENVTEHSQDPSSPSRMFPFAWLVEVDHLDNIM
ncbi:hypothetical protein AGABI1DRAFT_32817 [Agaricus bisporus var. burnettii JB137-S8]|uniref:Ino eighty subunit 1 n=1 Tax=Agaricus bisporus var. burnettii (strain JB137-S8 / ATCC MYA-4627 / FGSC 10392) TaxID=597362 RepID=K5XJM3_AGABU|nr:uncharacterized protein AGABI1DRAFT_32817 [Agaricus bisporus var. burnettii JB137-S8]EKM83703.1 hypothetical protein AGABI1DRAFT_32817 [Agaricus bisporus var. burnettii JB137-S8]